jgi:hypothetical protein
MISNCSLTIWVTNKIVDIQMLIKIFRYMHRRRFMETFPIDCTMARSFWALSDEENLDRMCQVQDVDARNSRWSTPFLVINLLGWVLPHGKFGMRVGSNARGYISKPNEYSFPLSLLSPRPPPSADFPYRHRWGSCPAKLGRSECGDCSSPQQWLDQTGRHLLGLVHG